MFTIVILPIIGLLFGFGLILFLIIKILPLSAKLLKIRIKKVTNYINQYEKYESNPRQKSEKGSTRNNTSPKVKSVWMANGWYYDEAKGKWTAPDYQTEAESKEAAERKARYYERRKAEGREPTYEEWKAAKEAEKHQDK